MTGRFILADLTSHKRGFGVQSAINAAARQAQKSTPSGKVIWIVPGHLAATFAKVDGVVACDLLGSELWSEIRRQVDALKARSGADCEIRLVTWDSVVYDCAQNSGLGLITAKWFTWLSENRTDRVVRPRAIAPQGTNPGSAEISSPDEIEKIVIDYLRTIGSVSEDTALYRSRLRPGLQRNPNLEKAILNPLFGFTLKTTVDSAVRRGVLAESRAVPGQEKLWLVPKAPSQVAPAQVLETKNDSAGPAVAPTAKPTSDPVYARSGEFRKRLTGLGIYCEKRERDILTEALARLLTGGPQPISRLRRGLPQAARDIVTERNIDCQTDFKRIVGFFLKLMLMAGALLDKDGKVIQRDLRSEAAEVVGSAERMMDVIELFMLEQILKKSDVKDRESWQLALALFRQFDQSVEIDGMLDRVAFLTSRLGDRFILTDDGTYECVQPSPLAVMKKSA